MKCLVTAGNTQVLIDRVRCITNIFSGRTGTRIALELHRRGHEVVLLTSTPDVVAELSTSPLAADRWRVKPFTTYQDLSKLMQEEITTRQYQTIVHSAAVSDYLAGGVFTPNGETHFDANALQWESRTGHPQLRDVSAGKVKSNHEELWLRFVKAPKLIDQIRSQWNYQSALVKFKLEVGIDRQQLEAIAEASRLQSQADWMVANTLEGMHEWALMGPLEGKYVTVSRTELAGKLADCLGA